MASDDKTPPAKPPTTKRPVPEVQRDLDKAKARFREIHPKVELDNRRGNAHAETIRKRRDAWAKQNPGEAFDEVIAGFSLDPYESNIAIQEEFHGLHYEICRLEDELSIAVRDRAKAGA